MKDWKNERIEGRVFSETQRRSYNRWRKGPENSILAGIVFVVVAAVGAKELFPYGQAKGGAGDLESLYGQGKIDISLFNPALPHRREDILHFSPHDFERKMRDLQRAGQPAILMLSSPDKKFYCRIQVNSPNDLVGLLHHSYAQARQTPHDKSAQALEEFCVKNARPLEPMASLIEDHHFASYLGGLMKPTPMIVTESARHDPFVLAGISRL